MALADNVVNNWSFASDYTDNAGTDDFTNSNATIETGKIGNGVEFDANTDYIHQAGAAISAAFSVNIWMKIDTKPSVNSFAQVISRTAAGSVPEPFEIRWQRLSGTDTLAFLYGDGISLTSITYNVEQDTGVWHMFTITRNGTAKELYFDGTSVASTTDAQSMSDDTLRQIRCGRWQFGTDVVSLIGMVDEITIWDLAINSDDVTALWNSGSGLAYPFSAGTQLQLNIGDDWKTVDAIQINIGDAWKAVSGMQINIGDAWKTIF